jgi:hypothetical protein
MKSLPLLALSCFLAGCGCSDDDRVSKSSAGGGGGAGGGDTGGGGGSGGTAQGGSGGASGSGSAAGAGGAPSACGPVVEDRRCLGNGWCFDYPLPQGADLLAVDGTPDGSSVWAVGTLGSAFRQCRGSWYSIDTSTPEDLHDVWSPSADFALAVGENGTVIRWDGSNWSKLTAPVTTTLLSVWGSSPTDVWVGGAPDKDGLVLAHYDGATWNRVGGWENLTTASVNSIRGRGPADVHAVGGVVLHFDGTAWSQVPVQTSGYLSDLALLDDGTTLALQHENAHDRILAHENGIWVESLAEQSHQWGALFRDGAGSAVVVAFADVVFP